MITMLKVIPNTPRSCIEAMATTANNRLNWEKQWNKFYNIYFDFIKICVANRFKKYNWEASGELLGDTIALVFSNTIKAVKLYDMTKTSFHNYLFGIVRFSVLQAIKARKNDARAVVFDETKNEIRYFLKDPRNKGGGSLLDSIIEKITLVDDLTEGGSFIENLCHEERQEACRALYAELIEETKSRVSPRVAAVFHLRVSKGLSSRETAARLGIAENIVDNDKYKFIKKLNEIASKEPFLSEINQLKD